MQTRDWLLKGVIITTDLNYFERPGLIIIMITFTVHLKPKATLN